MQKYIGNFGATREPHSSLTLLARDVQSSPTWSPFVNDDFDGGLEQQYNMPKSTRAIHHRTHMRQERYGELSSGIIIIIVEWKCIIIIIIFILK